MRPRPIPRKTDLSDNRTVLRTIRFNEAAADTAENGGCAYRGRRGAGASMRPRPIPRKTRQSPASPRYGTGRFNEAAADTAENVQVAYPGSASSAQLQ